MSEPAPRKPSCADWVESMLQRSLSDFQRLAVEVLVEGMGTGPWNISVNWSKVQWDFGHGVSFVLRGEIATTDFDRLTRLVLTAHENCVRVSLTGAGPDYIRISIHPRTREGGYAERCPTIEEAVALFRGTP